MSVRQMHDEMQSTQEAVDRVLGYNLWTVDSRDWELDGQAGSIAENVRTTTSKKGGVILLHDTLESTAEALPQVIAQYAAAGFSFTTVLEMLADKYGVEPDSIQPTPGG